MVEIQSGILMKEVNDELNIKSAPTPNKTSEMVNLVYPINKKYSDILKSSAKTTTGTSTIYTTPTDIDFFITYFQLIITKDAANDNIAVSINVTNVDGATQQLCNILTQTTTAGTFSVNEALPFPIKLARGAVISYGGTFAAGTQAVRCTIAGFLL